MKKSVHFRNWFPSLCLSLAVGFSGCGKNKPAGFANNPASMLDVSNKLAAIAATGDPVTLEALNNWYEKPAPGRNAADIYGQAMQALTADDPKASAFLADNQRALALLLQDAIPASCRYPIDTRKGAATELPHLAKIKRCAQLLQAEAVHQADQGRTDASAKAVVAGVRLARSLEGEPLIISHLVEIASLALTFQGLEQALSRHTFADADLLSIQATLRDAEEAASLQRALVGERCLTISHFQMPPAELEKFLGNTESGTSQNPGLANYFNTPVYQQDFNFALDSFSNLIAVAQMPFPDCLDARAGKGGQNNLEAPPEFILSHALLPSLDKLQIRAADATARIRIVRTVLAVERYRLQHQALPDSLNALVPDYLEAVPNDPFDGRPLRYGHPSVKGYIIYSVGRNRTDDKGSTQPTAAKDSSPRDITFAVSR